MKRKNEELLSKVASPILDHRPGLQGDPAFLICMALLFWGVRYRGNDPSDHSFTRDMREVGRGRQQADQSGGREVTRATDKRVAWRENGERQVEGKLGAWLLKAWGSHQQLHIPREPSRSTDS